MKTVNTRTNFETDALALASHVDSNFDFLQKNPLNLNPKTSLVKKIQIYLDRKSSRIAENELLGIIGIHDVFNNHTGGRIHLVAGMKGPLIESIQRQVIPGSIDYEDKHKLFIKAVQNVSGKDAPYAGNIHFHLFLCNGRQVTPKILLEFIQKEHGYQNDLQQIADARIYILSKSLNRYYWKSNANSEMIDELFS